MKKVEFENLIIKFQNPKWKENKRAEKQLKQIKP